MNAVEKIPGPLCYEEFLAHALAIEEEAVTRYNELAAQMQVHNNHAVARVFNDLARAEAEHVGRVRRLARGHALPALKPWEYRWQAPESPESAPYDAAHYLMTPHHALSLALAAEKRAERFFQAAAERTADPGLKALAREFAEEETAHVARVTAMLERTPAPPAGWAVDYDPPIAL